MHRRAFIAATAATPLISPLSSKATPSQTAAPNPVLVWRRFEITTKITLQNSVGEAQLWLPLAQTAAGYQIAIDVNWQGNGRTELVRDPTYGAQISVCRSKRRERWGLAPRNRLAGAGCKPP
jgi:hypothetical protein